MAGAGKSVKPYYVNIGEEDGFGQESSSYYALSGDLDGLPDFNPSYEEVKIPSHTVLGEQRITKQGKSKHTLGLSYSSITNFRFLAHVWGGRLDQQLLLELESGSGTFQVETISGGTSGAVATVASLLLYDLTLDVFSRLETLTGGTSSATGVLDRIENDLYFLKSIVGVFAAAEEVDGGTSGAKMKVDAVWNTLTHKKRSVLDFTIGETITGTTSNATGTVKKIIGNELIITVDSGTFAVDETITGGTSTATATTVSLAIINVLKRKSFATGEVITGATSAATGNVPASDGIIYQHDIFVRKKVNPKSLVYVQDDITVAQHRLLGGVGDDCEIKATAGKSPITGSVKYKASAYGKDTTVDVEQAIETVLDVYEYSDVDFTIDGTNYEHIAKAVTMGYSRGHSDIDTFNGINPVGYGAGDLASKLSYEIHQENFALIDLMVAGESFSTVVTMRRGTSGEDECIITYTCSLHASPLKEGQSTFLQTVAPSIHGTPTAVARDKIANYT